MENNITNELATIREWLAQQSPGSYALCHIARALGVDLAQAERLLQQAPTAEAVK